MLLLNFTRSGHVFGITKGAESHTDYNSVSKVEVHRFHSFLIVGYFFWSVESAMSSRYQLLASISPRQPNIAKKGSSVVRME
jgi:hypothetical protein